MKQRGMSRMALTVAVLGGMASGLSACAPHHRAAPVASPPPAAAAATGTAEPVLVNDPSAPADTPLCGHAAREANAIGATIHPDITPERSSCAANACFDPQTGTYIGADGNRHVCR
ncbi:BA14K family protein [Gluconacetobacter entanii]|uniref:BA14K family protein n=1 Tax=Gluconacetobacter entanii TaxID=108528 RepID=UPI0021BBF016|nr:BA14K family protein [Gluconacetobacter entanii]MCW4583291.1 BA14K family protein [Gluconacetobacter entanii]